MQEFLPHERQALIRRKLAEEGRVLAAELALAFSTSEDTVRRDLREMAAAGLCRRVYGGAAPNDGSQPLSRRIAVDPERKQRLAEAVVDHLDADMSVFIDAGSTNLAIARAIPPGLALSVITNTPLIAVALMERPDIDVVLIGGRMDHKSGGVLGARANQEAQSLRADVCILGSCGLDVERGVTAAFLEEAEFKRAIALSSRRIFAAFTSDKLGVPAAFPVVPVSPALHVFVEADADQAQCGAIAALGAKIISVAAL
jgi:DeoR/GlpR family transcriptional regulator of sugar metabolism